MNARTRVQFALKGLSRDRPLFCPAIYEHKARLLNKSPSEVGQSAELLAEAVLAEYDTYRPDMLTVGIDVYNVEAEALGSHVFFPQTADAVPVIDGTALQALDGLDKLKMVNPETCGRMPVVLQAAAKVNAALGNKVYVRGAVSAPYSTAVGLLGIEKVIIAVIDEPAKMKELMSFCTEVSLAYGRVFLQRGIEVCLFDSYAAPPLLSPGLYRDCVLPYVRRLCAELKRSGAEFVEYVIGGRTEPIASYLFAAGSDIVLSDFVSDVNIFLKLAADNNILVRRNISPLLIEQGPDEELYDRIRTLVKLASEHRNVIIGTGAISYNTRPERLLEMKRMCLETFASAS